MLEELTQKEEELCELGAVAISSSIAYEDSLEDFFFSSIIALSSAGACYSIYEKTGISLASVVPGTFSAVISLISLDSGIDTIRNYFQSKKAKSSFIKLLRELY